MPASAGSDSAASSRDVTAAAAAVSEQASELATHRLMSECSRH